MKRISRIVIALINMSLSAAPTQNTNLKTEKKENIKKTLKMRNQLQLEKSNLLKDKEIEHIALDAIEGRDLYLALKTVEADLGQEIKSDQKEIATLNLAIEKIETKQLKRDFYNTLFLTSYFILFGVSLPLPLLAMCELGALFYYANHSEKIHNAIVSEKNRLIAVKTNKGNNLALNSQQLNLLQKLTKNLHNYYGTVLINLPNNPLKIRKFYDIFFECEQ